MNTVSPLVALVTCAHSQAHVNPLTFPFPFHNICCVLQTHRPALLDHLNLCHFRKQRF